VWVVIKFYIYVYKNNKIENPRPCAQLPLYV
jgi:hypothetical protein